GARRSTRAHRSGGAVPEGHLALLDGGLDRRHRGGSRGNHGGAGEREVIDSHAIVSPRAELAADVTVGPFSVIGPEVRIGAGTVVGPHAVINGPTTIGAGNRIFQFASIGDAPQDKKYGGEPTRLEIGDRNLFMAYSHVAHDCLVGSNTVFANCAALAGHVEIGDWVTLGGLTAVHQFTRVGAYAFVGGGAIVTRDAPPYVMA